MTRIEIRNVRRLAQWTEAGCTEVGHGLPDETETMIHELDAVALNVNLPGHGLKKGDVRTVVVLHRDGEMEVEFVAYSGDTVALVHLQPKQVQTVGRNDVPHVRHRDPLERQRASKAQARAR